MKPAINDITKAKIQSKPQSDAYSKGFEKLYSGKDITYANEFILDLHDEGYWLARWHNDLYPIGHHKASAIKVIDKLNSSHRPNLEFSNGSLMVCWNNHEKGPNCEWEVLVKDAI